jgi:hypothetical protein
MRALAGVAALVPAVIAASGSTAAAAEPTSLRDCPLGVAEPAQTVTADVGGGWSATSRIPGRLQPSRPRAQGRMEAVLRALDGRAIRLVGRTRTCRPITTP